MEAKDLRIGNVVQTGRRNNNSGIQITITGIEKDPDGYYVHYGEERKDITYVSGIPLTEEWLVKLGFEKCDKEVDNVDMSYFRMGNIVVHPWTRFERSDKLTAIFDTYVLQIGVLCLDTTYLDFVHQLQNLYFALTGKELELKQ